MLSLKTILEHLTPNTWPFSPEVSYLAACPADSMGQRPNGCVLRPAQATGPTPGPHFFLLLGPNGGRTSLVNNQGRMTLPVFFLHLHTQNLRGLRNEYFGLAYLARIIVQLACVLVVLSAPLSACKGSCI